MNVMEWRAATLPSRERVPIEEYQPGEQLRCFVKAVEETGRGPEIVLSRSAPEFVIKLFTLEVSEIADGTVQIVSVAREPGWRTKLAVHSDDQRVDPVGACVGLRGQRVKNIVRELNNEKVDIIHWNPDIREFVAEALKPAVLREVDIKEADKRVQVWVTEDQLSLAIGKRGQNARLASRLTGWQIDINAEEVETLTFDDQVAEAVNSLSSLPGVGEELAQTLVNSGFHSVNDLKQIEPGDLDGIPALEEHSELIIAAAAGQVSKEVDGVEASNEAGSQENPEERAEQTAPSEEHSEDSTLEEAQPQEGDKDHEETPQPDESPNEDNPQDTKE